MDSASVCQELKNAIDHALADYSPKPCGMAGIIHACVRADAVKVLSCRSLLNASLERLGHRDVNPVNFLMPLTVDGYPTLIIAQDLVLTMTALLATHGKAALSNDDVDVFLLGMFSILRVWTMEQAVRLPQALEIMTTLILQGVDALSIVGIGKALTAGSATRKVYRLDFNNDTHAGRIARIIRTRPPSFAALTLAQMLACGSPQLCELLAKGDALSTDFPERTALEAIQKRLSWSVPVSNRIKQMLNDLNAAKGGGTPGVSKALLAMLAMAADMEIDDPERDSWYDPQVPPIVAGLAVMFKDVAKARSFYLSCLQEASLQPF